MKRYLCFTASLMVISISLLHPVSGSQGDEGTVVLVMMGDMVFDGELGERIKTQGRKYPFEEIKPHIQDADLTLANLETPISDRGEPEEDKYCTFRSDPDTLDSLTYAGIDGVSLANNHCLDYGYEALNDTMEHLEDEGIMYAGIWYDDTLEEAEVKRPVIFDVNGLRVGFLAYTENVRDHWAATGTRAGPMPLDPELIERDVRKASELSDVLIVSIHWRKWPQYTEGPEESDRELCRDAVDWGADIIMGHGPHTVHEIEERNGGVILYSLGNSAMNTGNSSSYYSYIARLEVSGSGISVMELVPIKRGTYRYVPMGTPIMRTEDSGFNVTRDEIWNMYRRDSYGVIDDEGGINELLILWDTSPWYMRTLLLILAMSLILLVGTAAVFAARKWRSKGSNRGRG